MKRTDTTIQIGPYTFTLCKDIVVDDDLDLLVTGACVSIDDAETMFFIRNEILDQYDSQR